MADNNFELNFKNFFEIYKKQVVPELKKHEEYRKDLLEQDIKEKKRYISIFSLGIVLISYTIFMIAVPYNILSSIMSSTFQATTMVGSLLLGIHLIKFSCKHLDKNYNKCFKDFLKDSAMNLILQTFGDIKWISHDKKEVWKEDAADALDYMIKNKTSQYEYFDRFDESSLFWDINIKYLDDEFKGTYKDVPFHIYEMEIHPFEHYNSKLFSFNGIVISFKYNKKIKNRTIVTTERNIIKKEYSIVQPIIEIIYAVSAIALSFQFKSFLLFLYAFILAALIVALLATRKKEEPLNKITLEDTKFNKKFNVFSSDEVEARYLVTPLFMELLNNLQTSFGVKKLKCSFFDDNLMIAISTKRDLFEIGDIRVPVDNPKFILNFYKELSSIYKMVEYFKLNKKLYPQNE